jgi:hypothetical protein
MRQMSDVRRGSEGLGRVRIFFKRQSWWAKFRLFSFKLAYNILKAENHPGVFLKLCAAHKQHHD